jgi:hypothetical protein
VKLIESRGKAKTVMALKPNLIKKKSNVFLLNTDFPPQKRRQQKKNKAKQLLKFQLIGRGDIFNKISFTKGSHLKQW